MPSPQIFKNKRFFNFLFFLPKSFTGERVCCGFMFALLFSFGVQAQVTYTFTNAGATGRFGPSQAQINAAYLATNLNGSVVSTAGVQTWTVPPGITQVRIEAFGAQGGNSNAAGGLGARMSGDFTVTPGQVLKIVVGQMGISFMNGAAGGGGGSYVATNANVPLLVAGGGSGASAFVAGLSASTGSLGNSGQNCSNAGVTGFGGGSASACNNGNGGGGGFYGNGISTGSWGYQFGYGFVNGSNGGTSGAGNCFGGFGGGGGTHSNNTGGGPGGGYTGGGAAYHSSSYVGGAGSSFNAGTNQSNSSAVNASHGKVIISPIVGVGISLLTPLGCSGQSNAALSAYTNGGIPPYSFTWSPGGSNSATLTGLGPGTYTCFATDAGATSYTTTYTILQPTPLTGVISQTNVSCNSGTNGVMSVSVSGGIAPYTYSWSPVGGTLSLTSGRSAGTYTCYVQDAYGCVLTQSTVLTQAPPFNLSALASATQVCAGQSLTLIGLGATSYTWSNGVLNGVPFVPVNTSSYVLTATNASGCIGTAFTSVTVLPSPTLTLAGNSTVCAFAQAVFSVTGANSYTWNTAATGSVLSFTPGANIGYTVSGTGLNGCIGSASKSIAVIPLPNIGINASSTLVCEGNPVVLTGFGGSNFIWSNGVISGVAFTPSSSQVYTLTGSNVNGCTNSATLAVNVNPKPVLSIAGPGTVCVGNSVLLSASGANSFTWSVSGNAPSIVVMPAGSSQTYSVSGTNGFGCVGMAAHSITVQALPVLSITSTNLGTVCAGTSLLLNASGGASYTWQPGGLVGSNVTYNPISSSVYTVIGADALGCINTSTAAFQLLPKPNVLISGPASMCFGDTATLLATGAISYTWSPLNLSATNVTVSPSSTTIYSVSGTSSIGCIGQSTFNLFVKALPLVNGVSSHGILCAEETATLYASGASTYLWNNSISGSTIIIQPSVTTVYTLTGTGSNSCSASFTLEQTVDLCTGIKGSNEDPDRLLNIFPNPSNGSLVVSGVGDAEMVVYNELGQIAARVVLDQNTEHQIDLTGLPSGVYFATIRYNGSFLKSRIVINK